MKQYKLINNVTGWITFIIAAFTYISTIEPTASFWDCGEFITSAFKLEVGHPPGAPMFMIIANVFTLFSFGDVSKVPVLVNIMSALASAFTILFLFWTITHIARRLIVKENEEISDANIIAIMGAGFIGALAFTFSDSFWFSAVEGEVYAMSSFFTAIVFWAILKWESVSDEKYANRWIVLIAYLMGLSIGVHLLNLLAIPAIVFIYYFKKYKTSTKGIISASLISIAILGFVMYGLVQGLILSASVFELMFVNGFGMPFNFGAAFYIVLLMGFVILGIYLTHKQNKVLSNVFVILIVFFLILIGNIFNVTEGKSSGAGSFFKLIKILTFPALAIMVYYFRSYFTAKIKPLINISLLCIAMILLGYSSFLLTIIRSSANTPMDQNNPDNVFALLRYLDREQYGDRPLIYGNYFNAPVTGYDEGSLYYAKVGDKYQVIDKKVVRKFESDYMTFFPRMYSEETSPNHVHGYKLWTGLEDKDLYKPAVDEKGENVRDQYGNVVYDKSKPLRAPSFLSNLEYFWKYQVDYMYFRYFMWNFAGRQSDIQGDDGNVMEGNWITGIKFFDDWRLGGQDKLTTAMKNNKGRNAYYMLPFLLGILGMIYMYRRNELGKKYFWVVLLFFFFTGLAIVLYLNQPPFQPRERDYAYAGSFYVFAIYIGFGVLILVDLLKKYLPHLIAAGIVTIASLILVPGIMAIENWDDHDRSGRYTCRDFASNYLNSCPPNAVIFTNGDNDTFPLWYAQEVEGVRTDVRVINLSYLNTDWYIEQNKRKVYNSDPVPFSFSYEQIMEGKRNFLHVADNPYALISEKYNTYLFELQPKYEAIFERFMKVIQKSKFPDMQPKDFEQLKKGAKVISPMQFANLITQISRKENVEKFGIQNDSLVKVKSATDLFMNTIASKPVPVKDLIKFAGSDDESAKTDIYGEMQNYIPSSKICIPVDRRRIMEKNLISKKYENQIVPFIEWQLKSRYIMKNDLMMLDLLANNNWERPVCFATTTGSDAYLHLDEHFRLNGMAYQLVPLKSKANDYLNRAFVDSDSLYKNLMYTFKWGGIGNPNIYIDENNMRMLMNIKHIFVRLTDQLITEHKYDSAYKVLTKCDSLMPKEQVPYNFYNILMADQYYKIGKTDKGDGILKHMAATSQEELDYFFSLKKQDFYKLADSYERSFAVVQEIIKIARKHKRTELDSKLTASFVGFLEKNLTILDNVKNMNKQNESQFYQWYQSLSDMEKQVISLYMFLLKPEETNK